jgi:hypothetical protein
MSIDEQMKLSNSKNLLLTKATLADIIHELKSRVNSVVVVMALDDEDGNEVSFGHYLGARLSAIGAMEDFKHDLLRPQASSEREIERPE